MTGTRAMALARFTLGSVVVCLGTARGARAERIPVHVNMQVKTGRSVQTRTLDSVEGRWDRDGSFSAPVQMSGNGWSFGAKFDGEFASGSRTYAGTGTARYTW